MRCFPLLLLGPVLAVTACTSDSGNSLGTAAANGPCASGKDCALGEGCADGTCRADGECQIDPSDYSDNCPDGQLCYSGSSDGLEGICASERPGINPYCRSDGMGACRSECASDGSCWAGASCVDGFCHWDDECAITEDCSPNHECIAYFDQGFSVCSAVEEPACVDVGGVCRYPCESNNDCYVGGGCEADGYCHASNECAADADCPAGQDCWADEHFGGLCGPPRD